MIQKFVRNRIRNKRIETDFAASHYDYVLDIKDNDNRKLFNVTCPVLDSRIDLSF